MAQDVLRPIVFLHIPKTGGTSLAAALKRNFRPEQVVGTSDLAAVGGTDGPGLVHGHFLFDAEQIDRLGGTPVTVLRHPVDRVISLYYYWRRDPGYSRHEELLNMSLRDFAALPHPEGGTCQANDDQVRRLSGVNFGFMEGTEAEFRLALRNLKRFRVGLFDDLETFWRGLARDFGLEDSPLPYENVTVDRPTADELDVKTRTTIKAHNRLDMALYGYVRRCDILPRL